jgi:serine O-acetyltransferase
MNMDSGAFKTLYCGDLKRYGYQVTSYLRIWHYLFRKAHTSKNPLSRFLFKGLFRIHSRKHGIEIPSCTRIGKGLYLGHAYNITVNGNATLGDNCHLHKGVTVGMECRGPRLGAPTIGNCVSIGVNASVVGKITIGDDVLIAPGAFVNCDVPSHSVVVGNPCSIHSRDNATEGYIGNLA